MPRGIPNTKKKTSRNGFKVNRKLFDALVATNIQLVRAYADGLSNGGRVESSRLDRAHELALRAQRMLLRQRRVSVKR